LRYADRAHTPLLLVHSELDQNCPLEQSEQMYTALKFLGRQVELAVLEGEGHLVNLVGRPSRRLARAAIIDEYLDRHLVGPPAVRPPSS
jgi:dipeptidyl aminopeptidase/acylaminoacyl peptidase